MFRGPVEGKHQAQQHTCCALTRTLSAALDFQQLATHWLHIAHGTHTDTHVCVTNQLCEPALGSNQPASAEGNYPRDGTFGTLLHWDKPTSNREMDDLVFH